MILFLLIKEEIICEMVCYSFANGLDLFALADDVHGFGTGTNFSFLLRNSDESFDSFLRSQVALTAILFGITLISRVVVG